LVKNWLSEKDTFRSLDADPTCWENWLERGRELGRELTTKAERFDGKQKEEILGLAARVLKDLDVYESARAIVSMQRGARGTGDDRQPPPAN
jgi:hypothetical protein